jgi:hypothetical protein
VHRPPRRPFRYFLIWVIAASGATYIFIVATSDFAKASLTFCSCSASVFSMAAWLAGAWAG